MRTSRNNVEVKLTTTLQTSDGVLSGPGALPGGKLRIIVTTSSSENSALRISLSLSSSLGKSIFLKIILYSRTIVMQIFLVQCQVIL